MNNRGTHLRRQAIGGVLWVSIGTVIGKLASVAAQLILGWILDSEDFALYAIAISWSAIVLALRNAGMQRLLIQKGNRYDEYASICLSSALLVNGLGCLLLASSASVLSQIYDASLLRPLLWVIAASLPMGTAAMIFQAKLSCDLRFRTLAQLNMLSAVLRHASMVAFALFGFGPLSFVLPLLVVALFETAAGWWTVGSWPTWHRLTWPALSSVLKESRWIMVTSLGAILVLNGDYLAISLLQPKDILGLYYFGFQLSFSLAALFTNGIEAVMMPAFAQLQHNHDRQRKAFFKASRILVFGTTLFCFPLILGAATLVHGLWQGKWDAAIPVVQLLAFSLPLKMVIPLCRSLLEGCGAWRLVAGLLFADGIGTIAAGAAGAWIGGLAAIATAVSAYNCAAGILFCALVSSRAGGRIRDGLTPLLSNFGVGAVALVMTMGMTLGMPGGSWTSLLQIAIYAAVYLALTHWLRREDFAEVASLVVRQSPWPRAERQAA